ncbi:hypothetical protein [Robiginitalea aurantiaca]|uniref:ATP-binding protein n=1 Tax=Robiginitalea aurantiaca TaxID=3056915 RepID=A0ABT7WBC8_9FLAO|nr:hypothetical protein [Robiginitalea aurantiaca]MDM9630224.1 hypothetical protein [Robiginitalea aurantiaca]
MAQPEFYSYKELDVNSDEGPRTAAILTFSGDVHDSLVKELTQNSLDARPDRKAKLRIRVRSFEMDKSDFPNFHDFEQKLNMMEAYWNSKGDQFKNFFKTAKKHLKGKTLSVFAFEDFNTSGLEGDDTEGTFKACVNDENVSKKSGSDSLGNHGIGKNSVFGYSAIQTVIYSSLNTRNEFKFKGISKLGHYKDETGVKRQNRIYYGRKSGDNVSLVDNYDEIPEVFRRDEPGLSQFVLAAETGDDWVDNVKRAFLTNYWLLFEKDLLEVHLNDYKLSFENFEREVEELFKDDTSDENPIHFIRAHRLAQIHETEEIHKIGEVEYYLMEANGDDNLPNRIVFLRDGMKIQTIPVRGGLPVSVAGVMYCNNERGNEILGAMEPHKHDQFLPDLIAKKEVRNVTVSDGKKVIQDLREFRLRIIRELKSKYTQEVTNVDFIDELFGSLFGIKTGSGSGEQKETEKESFRKHVPKLDIEINFNSSTRNSQINNLEDVDQGTGEGRGVGTGEGGEGSRSGKRKKRSEGGGAGSSTDKTNRRLRQIVKVRSFVDHSSAGRNHYKLVVHSGENLDSFDMLIGQHGDSGKKDTPMSSKLISVNSQKGNHDIEPIFNKKNEVKSYRIKGLMATDDKPLVYDIVMEENTRSALNIIDFE